MSVMATAHMIFGHLGTGKMTFAGVLAERVNGIRLSADDLYLSLYSDGRPTWELDDEWSDRLWSVLNTVWPQIVERGVDVVLDFGFWSRVRRDEARALAAAVGASTRLYRVDCPADEALRRCLHRNGIDHSSFVIDTSAFVALAAKVEPLGLDEPHELIVGH
jgi:predicted kinase